MGNRFLYSPTRSPVRVFTVEFGRRRDEDVSSIDLSAERLSSLLREYDMQCSEARGEVASRIPQRNSLQPIVTYVRVSG